MAPKTTIDLKLDNKSTFQDKPSSKGIKSQLELEKLYTKLYNKHRVDFPKTYTGPKDKFEEKLWKAFQAKNGVLLASDSPLTNPSKQGSKYGEGKPLFKVRFKDGKIQTGTAVQQQLRSWYTQLQTEGTPGTTLPLSKTKDQFFQTDDKGRTLKQQIHHEVGVMELSPHLEQTLQLLLSKDKNKIAKGQRQYSAFSKFTHKNNIILGDKAENFTGLAESQHINRPWSAHGYKGPSLDSPGTSWATTLQSGGQAFSDSTLKILRTGTINTPAGDINLDKSSSGENSFWDIALKPYTALSREAGIRSTEAARKFEGEETGRSKYQTKLPQDQGRNVRKILGQAYIEAGMPAATAGLMAASAYESIRTGTGKLRSSFIESGKPFSEYADLFEGGTAEKMQGPSTITKSPNLNKTNINIKLKPTSTEPSFVLENVTPDTIWSGNTLQKVQREIKTDKTLRRVRPKSTDLLGEYDAPDQEFPSADFDPMGADIKEITGTGAEKIDVDPLNMIGAPLFGKV